MLPIKYDLSRIGTTPGQCSAGFTRGSFPSGLQASRELARRLRGTGVTANCLHPGFVATRFADESGGLISRFTGLAKLLAISPEKGAETINYLASSPKIAATTGRYFYKCSPITPSDAARNDRAALLLWERSAALADLIT
jgi:hypothetical protein